MFARLRPIYNRIAASFGRASQRVGFTPDFWTLFSLTSAFLACVMLVRGEFWWALILVVVMNLSDMLDGATARASGNGSRFGTVLDHVVDRYAEFLLLAGLLVGGWISGAAVMFAASGVVMASYVRTKAVSAGGLQECLVGIAGRQEKLFLLMGSLVLLALGQMQLAEYLIWALGVISHITAVQRLLYARRQILQPGMPGSD